MHSMSTKSSRKYPGDREAVSKERGGKYAGTPQEAQYLTGHEGSTQPLFPDQDRIPPHILAAPSSYWICCHQSNPAVVF